MRLVVRYEPFEGDLSGALYLSGSRRIIGINATHHEHRQRFTLAHELGHFLLHARQVEPHQVFVDHALVWRRDVASSKAESPEEIEANQFAAELLVPGRWLRRDMDKGGYDLEEDEDVRKLARRYQVSLQTLNYQLIHLGLIP